jgi:dephospho-CoA kinase
MGEMSETDVKVICLVGMPGSGKGTCTDYMHATYGWPVVHFGNMVYEEVQRRGLDNVKDEKFVRKDMREKEGKTVLAIHVARKVKDYVDQGQKVVVLDGLYSWSEYKYLLDVFGSSLVVIAVAASKNVRHQRVIDRKDAHRSYTIEQLIDREYSEIEDLEKGGPIAYADYTIVNETAVDSLIAQLNGTLHTAGIL